MNLISITFTGLFRVSISSWLNCVCGYLKNWPVLSLLSNLCVYSFLLYSLMLFYICSVKAKNPTIINFDKIWLALSSNHESGSIQFTDRVELPKSCIK